VVLEPKQVEPGWASRWTRQSIELFVRNPFLAVFDVLLLWFVSAILPFHDVLFAPAAVILMSVLFCSLRAVDKDSGNAWTSTWVYFLQCSKDVMALAFYVLMSTGFVALVVWTTSPSHMAGFHSISVTTPTTSEWIVWVIQAVKREISMVILGVFFLGSIPLVYLTLLIGNRFLLHLHLGYRAAFLNIVFSDIVIIPGQLFCIFAYIEVSKIYSPYMLAFLSVFIAALFWWFGTWGYLWCREMFEGDKENAQATRHSSVRSLFPAHAS